MRFALTCRFVKPENIPVEDHHLGQFELSPEGVYDGN
jgi:hypothetical protein